MQGLWIEQGAVQLRDDLQLVTSSDELEVKVRLAGLCGTDLELLRGYYKFAGVPGHEFVGEVLTPGAWCGKRVVADINFGCGECEFCSRGIPHHCLSRRTLGINQASGAFAERISVPLENLLQIPDSVPDEHAVFAEPLAAAIQIVEQVELNGKRILLIGAGRLGRMIAWTIHHLVPHAGLTIGVRSPGRAQQLPENAEICSIQNLSGRFDVAIDCTGNEQGFALALEHLKAQGTLVVKSTYASDLSLNMSRIVVDEITVQGSRCGPMDKALAFLEAFPEVFSNTTQARFKLEDYQQAFELAGDPSIDKVLLQS